MRDFGYQIRCFLGDRLQPQLWLQGLVLGLVASLVLSLSGMPVNVYADDAKPAAIQPGDVGVVKNGRLVLCPKTSYTLDLSNHVSGRFTEDASSSNTSAATVRNFVDNADREHHKITVTAGENNGDNDITLTITVNVHKEKLNAGFPEAPANPKGHGIHGSGPNNGPHQIEPSETIEKTYTLTVIVLSQKKCTELEKQKPKKPVRPPVAVPGGGGQAVNPGRRLQLCVRGNRIITPQSDIRTIDGYQYRKKPEDNPAPIKGIQIVSNSSPDKVGVETMGQLVDGKLGDGPVKIVFTGLAVGSSDIVVSETPAPLNMQPFRETYHVTVVACDEKKISVTAIPEDYIKITYGPTQEDEEKKDEDDDFFKDEESSMPEDGTGTDEHSSVPKTDDMRNASANLVTVATFIDEDPVTVSCPRDAQGGDMISCSVLTDDPQGKEKLKNYALEIAGVVVPIIDGLATMEIPKAVEDSETAIALHNPAGESICHGKLPVSKALHSMPQKTPEPSDYGFPRTTHSGRPIEFKGPFNSKIQDTAVKVDGQQATILAKSPRRLIVENPTNTAGTKTVELQEGLITVKGPIEFTDNGQSMTTPSMNQASQQMCEQIVDAYRANLHSTVDNGWKPPKPPHKGEWVIVLNYELTRNRTITNVRVTQSSGYPPLDESARQRVYQIQGQFNPLPTCYDKPTLEVEHIFRVIYH